MDFFTAVLRQSGGFWVALCLENGVVGQGDSQKEAVASLKEAVESLEEAYESDLDLSPSKPISIQELHEFFGLVGGFLSALSPAGGDKTIN